MDIRIYQNRDKILVQLTGRVVLDECDRLKGAVVPRIVQGLSQVHLDLSRVEFIDSAGLGVLVGMKVSTNKSRASLHLVSPSKSVSDILVVSKLDSIFAIMTGAEAQGVIDELAKTSFLITGEATAAPRAASPSFQAPPSTPSPAGGGGSVKDQIDQLCKDAMEHMRLKDYDAAAESYKGALKLDPNYLPALNNLAIVYEKKPQTTSQAIALWEKVLAASQAKGDQKHVERAQKHLSALQNL